MCEPLQEGHAAATKHPTPLLYMKASEFNGHNIIPTIGFNRSPLSTTGSNPQRILPLQVRITNISVTILRIWECYIWSWC